VSASQTAGLLPMSRVEESASDDDRVHPYDARHVSDGDSGGVADLAVQKINVVQLNRKHT
jgi:hypothetical protein